MAIFEREAVRRGPPLQQYQAKIFGGGHMLTGTTLSGNMPIGSRNSKAAIELLAERNIPLLVTHIGETGSRRITFDLETGDVWVNHTPLSG